MDGYDTSYHGPETGRGGILKFNLGKSTDLASSYECCFEEYPSDDLAVVHRLEFLFKAFDLLSGFGEPGGIGVFVDLTKTGFEPARPDSAGAPI